MSQKNILELLSLPVGSSLATIEKAFFEKIQEKVQPVDNGGQSAPEKTKAEITTCYELFFSYTSALIKSFSSRPKNFPEPPDAARLREQAGSLIEDIQKHLISFTSCLLEINLHIAHVDEEIKKEDRLIKPGSSSRKIEWTSDIDVSTRRLKKRKRIIDKQNERLARGLVALDAAYRHYLDFNNALAEIATGDDRENLLRSYTSSMRLLKFPKAEKALREVEAYRKKFSFKNAPETLRKKAASSGMQYLNEIMKNQADIINEEEKLFIFPTEIRAKLEANVQEVKNIRKYIAKYHHPYMRGKLSSLNRLRDKLIAIGTLDRLLRLYVDLIRGLSEQMSDFQTIREYESNAVERAQYLNNNLFAEIPAISKAADEVMEVFRRDFALYHNEFKPEDFTGDFDDVPDDLIV